jgi:hypothetical protein
MIRSTIATTFLVSLGLGCGGTDSAATGDGGSVFDAESPADGNATTDAAGSPTDAPTDVARATDGAGATDSASAPDGTLGPDTGSSAAAAVDLRTAGSYVILAKTEISNVPTSAVTGNLGVSPAAATYITGFPLTPDATNVFSTSPQVTGKVYASTYAPPTPSNLTTAVSDMQLAFTDAAGRAPGVTELGAGNIGGMTLTAGVYKWGTGLLVPTNVTLTGSATDVWIFQVAQDLKVSNAVKVVLAGGAAARNVFWQVAGLVDLGTTSHLEGTVLSQTSIVLRTGASVNGRLLAQTAVTLDSSTVVEPSL